MLVLLVQGPDFEDHCSGSRLGLIIATDLGGPRSLGCPTRDSDVTAHRYSIGSFEAPSNTQITLKCSQNHKNHCPGAEEGAEQMLSEPPATPTQLLKGISLRDAEGSYIIANSDKKLTFLGTCTCHVV